jgi:glycosyltransferase involved in cell wall biosynthesis
MNVLFWHPVFVLGGGYQILRNMAITLSKNPAIQSIRLAINSQYDHDLLELFRKQAIDVHPISRSSSIGDFTSGMDVVYIVWPHGIALPKTELPCVAIYQDTIVMDSYGAHSTKTFLDECHAELGRTVSFYTRLIVTSEYTKQRFGSLLGESRCESISVLPHVPTPIATNPTLPLPDRFGIKPKSYIVYPANTAEHKNHITLLRSLCKRQRKEIKLVLCGYGTEALGDVKLNENPYINQIKRTMECLGLKPHVDFHPLGYVNDSEANALIQNALGLVMPTRAEGMGLPINDAINLEVPVITSDIPVLREHFSHRSHAILWVDPECPYSIAKAWDQLVDTHKELVNLARHNKDSGLTWESIGAKTVKILRGACQRNSEYIMDGSHANEQNAFERDVSRSYTKNMFRSFRQFFKRQAV